MSNKRNGEEKGVGLAQLEHQLPDGSYRCPFCGRGGHQGPFTAWFQMYRDQEGFKASIHNAYANDIKNLQDQRDDAKRELTEALWSVDDARSERDVAEQRFNKLMIENHRLLKKIVFAVKETRRKVLAEVCAFLRHYELKEIDE